MRFQWPPHRTTNERPTDRVDDGPDVPEGPDDPGAPGAPGAPGGSDVPARFSGLCVRTSRTLLRLESTWIGHDSTPWSVRRSRIGNDPPESWCPRCGLDVGPHEADSTGCPTCRRRRLPWDAMVRVGRYEGELREAILEVKLTRWHALGRALGRVLGERILERHPWVALAAERRDATVTSVGTHWTRRLSRGIDHAHTIALGVGEATGAEVERLVSRRRSPSQRRVGKEARLRNVSGGFASSRRRPPWSRDIPWETSGRGRPDDRWPGVMLVVDDVLTTGATMRGACRCLARADAPRVMLACVLGVTPRPGLRQRGSM